MSLRRLWPSSSFGRSFLLLTLLLLGSQGSVYILFHGYVLNPAAQRFARLLWQVDAALAEHPPAGLAWRISPDAHGGKPQSYFLQKVAQSFAGMGNGAQLRVEEKGSTVWLWLHQGPDKAWLGIPLEGMAFAGGTFTFVRLSIILLLTVLGAGIIVWQINRPLARLAASAPGILHGEYPDGYPLSRHAPQDIQELERTISGMAGDLHRLHEERTLLLTGISHELRTPLSRLLLSLHLPAEDWAREQPAMLADVEEMEEVLGNFLAWVQGGEQEKPVVIPVTQWLLEMATIARERYGLQVAEVLHDEGNFVGRPLALERVFRNLFDNSRRYAAGAIRLEARAEGGRCCFVVEDRAGEPISPAMLTAMNAGSLPRQPGHGSGMGIRLCHRLLSYQGARLEYRAAAMGGVVATVCLPREGAEGCTSL